MNVNFFSWMREGVKQSVLLGVSDAVEQIGVPAEEGDGNQRLLEVLRTGNTDAPAKKITGTTKRKKLGRSLKQIQGGLPKAA